MVLGGPAETLDGEWSAGGLRAMDGFPEYPADLSAKALAGGSGNPL
jgi:hypothetical protein